MQLYFVGELHAHAMNFYCYRKIQPYLSNHTSEQLQFFCATAPIRLLFVRLIVNLTGNQKKYLHHFGGCYRFLPGYMFGILVTHSCELRGASFVKYWFIYCSHAVAKLMSIGSIEQEI